MSGYHATAWVAFFLQGFFMNKREFAILQGWSAAGGMDFGCRRFFGGASCFGGLAIICV